MTLQDSDDGKDRAMPADRDDMTDKDREDRREHYRRMQQRHLVWYEGQFGGLFSIDVDHFIEQARENRDLFIEDGYPARIVRLTVVDDQPVAEWVE